MRRGMGALWRAGHSLPLPTFDMCVKLQVFCCHVLHTVYLAWFQLVDRVVLPCYTVIKKCFGWVKKLCREFGEHDRWGTTAPCSSRGSADVSWPGTAWKSTVLCCCTQCFLWTFNINFHASFWYWTKTEDNGISYQGDMMVFSHLGEGWYLWVGDIVIWKFP